MDPAGKSSSYQVIIIDGMAVVNSVTKTEQIKTCQDFADAFLQIICNITAQYGEVRLVFDWYIKTSLKEQNDEDKEYHGESQDIITLKTTP